MNPFKTQRPETTRARPGITALVGAKERDHTGETELNRVRLKIGMQSQNAALFDSLTVYDNLVLLDEYGMGELIGPTETEGVMR